MKKTITVYTIDQHPNKEAVYEYIRDNWHDLAQYAVDEFIDSLNALNNAIGGNLDYSVSQVPDRREYITLTDFDSDKLESLNPDDCPLTGVYCDYEVINGLKNGSLEHDVLKAIHAETEHQYSDDALFETCEANEYYFFENGMFAK